MANLRPIDAATLENYLGDGAADLLTEYYKSGNFTGGRFERFSGGGDASGVANAFGPEDIVAVSLLGVRIPGKAALEILEVQRKELSDLLAQIPNGLNLWDAEEAEVNPDSAASRLWTKLVGLPGVNWVTAGKLVARKRPQLIPVYDRVVKAGLNRKDSDEFWRPLRSVLAGTPRIIDRVDALRSELSLTDISHLRILDVAIWMKDHGQPEPVPEPDQ